MLPRAWLSGGYRLAYQASFLIIVFATFLGCLDARSQALKDFGGDFLTSTFTLETLWEPAVSAGTSIGWSDYVSPIAGYSSGAEGYGHHYAVALGDNVNGKFMRDFAFAAASGHRDDYIPLMSGGVWKRIGNAALHTFFVDPRELSKTFNWSGLPASFASAGLSNIYQPTQQRTWSATFVRVGTNSAGYVAGDIWKEFTYKGKEKHPKLYSLVKR